jgi:hypothetical protein
MNSEDTPHWKEHQQALVVDNFIIKILSFLTHDEEYIKATLKKYKYDEVLNLCELQQYAIVGSTWTGTKINTPPLIYPSWTLGEDLDWHAPVPRPEEKCCWDEKNQTWVDQFKTPIKTYITSEYEEIKTTSYRGV